jgi:hypothetical protein
VKIVKKEKDPPLFTGKLLIKLKNFETPVFIIPPVTKL